MQSPIYSLFSLYLLSVKIVWLLVAGSFLAGTWKYPCGDLPQYSELGPPRTMTLRVLPVYSTDLGELVFCDFQDVLFDSCQQCFLVQILLTYLCNDGVVLI